MALFRLLAISGVACVVAGAQGTAPKASASEYAAHTDLRDGALGAENLGHSVLAAKGALVVRDYLVVEAALYTKSSPMRIRMEQFRLRINGKKGVILPQALGSVIASLKYPDWQSRPTLMAGAGVGNAGVTIGPPVPVERFPGDNRPIQNRLPNPPRAPEDSNGVEESPPEPVEDVINRLALPEGDEVHPPASGYLFFPFQSKLKSIKTLELIYEGPLGTAALRLP